MGQTSIPVREEVRDTLMGDKPDGMSWSDYLLSLHGGDVDFSKAGAGDDKLKQLLSEVGEQLDQLDDVHETVEDINVRVDQLPRRTAERTAEELEGRFA